MGYSLNRLVEADRAAVISIFNFFVESSFAAYPDQPAGDEFFDRVLTLGSGYPAVTIRTEGGETIGFGFLRPFHPAATFRRTAELAYFLLPDHTRRGLGTLLLSHFVAEARAMGMDNLLANVSSLNEQSLRFHQKAGFTRCGTFRAVGRKSGCDFDMVWFQMRL